MTDRDMPFPKPAGGAGGPDGNFYLLLVEFHKALQQQSATQTQLLSEMRLSLSNMSERMARMEAQDLGNKVRQLDDDLRHFKDNELTRIKDELSTIKHTRNPEMVEVQASINQLKNEHASSQTANRIYVGAAGFVGSMIPVIIGLIGRVWDKTP